MTGTYRIAEKNIRIISVYDTVHSYCADYRTDAAPDFTVETAENDIHEERLRSARQNEREGNPVQNYSFGYLEELAVYRKIAEQMPYYDTFLFHGSALAVDGKAYLFTAKSGTGKSTHARLWRKKFGKRVVMINDDKPLIRISGDAAIVYGTPYNGKHRVGSNISVPLKAICILEQDAMNHIEPIDKAEAYSFLLQQVYHPEDRAAFLKTLALLKQLTEHVSMYRLGCNMDPEAAEVSYNGMK